MSASEAVIGADVLVALTEWNDFRALDLNQASQFMWEISLLIYVICIQQ